MGKRQLSRSDLLIEPYVLTHEGSSGGVGCASPWSAGKPGSHGPNSAKLVCQSAGMAPMSPPGELVDLGQKYLYLWYAGPLFFKARCFLGGELWPCLTLQEGIWPVDCLC